MKRCMYCGQENDDANTTCEKCGNQLLELPPQTEDIEELEELDELEERDVIGDLSVPDDLQDFMPEDMSIDMPEYDEAVGEGEPELSYEEDDPDADPEYGQDIQYGEEDGADEQYGGSAYGYYDNEPGQYGARPEDDYERGYAQSTVTPLMKASRRSVKGFLFFMSSLFLTVHVIANIVNILLGNALTNLSTVSNTIELQVGSNAVLKLANTGIDLLNGINPWILRGVGVGLMLPTLLLMFGLWGMFNKTTTRRAAMSTGGYSLTRAAVIIQFILVCAVLLAVIVMTVSFVVAAGASGSTMSLIVGIVLLLIVVILAVLTIMYYVQVIFAIRLVRKNVTGEDIGILPGYAIFVTFLLALFNGLALLPMAADDYIGLVARGANCAWLLFITLWAVLYKSKLKKVRRPRR